jgi:ubiquitin C-terminal hydrolase
MEKITNRVQFPLENLQLSRYISPGESMTPDVAGTCYDLFGVCNHLGTVSGGHYTCFVRNKDQWVEYDDEEASIIDDINTIVSDKGYILFYRRHTDSSNTV